MIVFKTTVPISCFRRWRGKTETYILDIGVLKQVVSHVVGLRMTDAVPRKGNINNCCFVKSQRSISEIIHLADHDEHADDQHLRDRKLQDNKYPAQSKPSTHF